MAMQPNSCSSLSIVRLAATGDHWEARTLPTHRTLASAAINTRAVTFQNPRKRKAEDAGAKRGLTLGWLSFESAASVQRRIGKGKLYYGLYLNREPKPREGTACQTMTLNNLRDGENSGDLLLMSDSLKIHQFKLQNRRPRRETLDSVETFRFGEGDSQRFWNRGRENCDLRRPRSLGSAATGVRPATGFGGGLGRKNFTGPKSMSQEHYSLSGLREREAHKAARTEKGPECGAQERASLGVRNEMVPNLRPSYSAPVQREVKMTIKNLGGTSRVSNMEECGGGRKGSSVAEKILKISGFRRTDYTQWSRTNSFLPVKS